MFRLIELVNRLEASENGGDFAPLELGDVPGFDALFAACERAGVSFNAEGLRSLARQIAARKCKPVSAVLAMRPDAVAACVQGNFRAGAVA